jgi:hypothetical protein
MRKSDGSPPIKTKEFLMTRVENGDEDARVALREFQRIRTAGGQPEIRYSEFHGWRVEDPLADSPSGNS